MNDIQWYFPKTLEEVQPHLKRDGVKLHGGGTWILRGSMRGIKGLVDLGKLELHSFRKDSQTVEMGAGMTYAETIRSMTTINPDHILVKALQHAASTPLRNIITLGGTIFSFPVWSDLMGPLIALDADVVLMGERSEAYSITEYVKSSALRKESLITHVRFKNIGWNAYYYREVKTSFDYPAFTITILLKKNKNLIEDTRIVVVGCAGKFSRVKKIEDYLKGKTTDSLEIDGIAQTHELKFTKKRSLEPAYLEHCAGVQIERSISELTRG
ncbi:MAG: FAD binding domain-containing protein [Spirochaetota bacterium]|nr:MAG: FAD binding domain-containing protein [Spirochaetota bacterium]